MLRFLRLSVASRIHRWEFNRLNGSSEDVLVHTVGPVSVNTHHGGLVVPVRRNYL